MADTEVLLPVSTVSNSLAIFPSEGGPANAHTAVGGGVGDDDTTGLENTASVVETAELGLADPVGTPNTGEDWTVRARAKFITNPPQNLVLKVMEGASVRATLDLTATVTATLTTFAGVFDPIAVADADALTLLLSESRGLGGGNIQTMAVELEIDTSTPATSGAGADGEAELYEGAARGPTIINPPVTITKLGPSISESLEEDIESPTMPTPMAEPPLDFGR